MELTATRRTPKADNMTTDYDRASVQWPQLIFVSLDLNTTTMTDPTDRPATSLYDYSDKSVQHAGCAAIAFAIISLFSGLLACIQYFLYHRPGTGGFISHGFVSQQYLQHTPLITAIAVGFSIIIAAISSVLAFFIFRRSRFAVVAMVIFVIVLQLYTWFVAHSPAGTLVSIIVVAFLLRGARRIFQDYAERKMEAEKV